MAKSVLETGQKWEVRRNAAAKTKWQVAKEVAGCLNGWLRFKVVSLLKERNANGISPPKEFKKSKNRWSQVTFRSFYQIEISKFAVMKNLLKYTYILFKYDTSSVSISTVSAHIIKIEIKTKYETSGSHQFSQVQEISPDSNWYIRILYSISFL